MILKNFQKRFNTVDYKILLEKMICSSFKTSVIKWFEYFLSNRKFFLFVDDTFSKAGILNFGVPLRSILGLLPFLTYETKYSRMYQVKFVEDSL